MTLPISIVSVPHLTRIILVASISGLFFVSAHFSLNAFDAGVGDRMETFKKYRRYLLAK